MALLIIARNGKQETWARHLRAADPELDIRVWPETGRPDEVKFALCWQHPPGELKKYPNLKCIASMGAGVDHILADPELPAGVPVTRVVEPSMAQSMSEYVVLAVLSHCRNLKPHLDDQQQRKWNPRIPLLVREVEVGIMGLGQLGSDAACKLHALGFPVRGWSRSEKSVPRVRSFAGQADFQEFLAGSRVLVCLLPLTPATRGILNRSTFAGLPGGAYLVNAARGEHLVEQDLLEALAEGRLAGACLDVFREEPLPAEHPFWRHPKIVVTPHISSLTYAESVAPQIAANYRRLQTGEPLLNLVDRARGY